MFTFLAQLALGLLMIAALLAVQGAILYAMWWAALMVVRLVPMIGRRGRHAEWERLNNGYPAAGAGIEARFSPADGKHRNG